MVKLSHVMVGSSDLEASKKFYDAVFATMGGAPGVVDAKGRIVYGTEQPRFLVTKPINGQAATFANGGTISFAMKSQEKAVEAWRKSVKIEASEDVKKKIQGLSSATP